MRILRWLIRIASAVLIVAIIVAAAVFFGSQRALSKRLVTPDVTAPNLARVDVTRGEHMVKSMTGCEECHGADLGGKVFLDDPALGKVYAPNLTSGAGGFFAANSDVDFVRAVRYGVAQNGRRLLFMPSDAFAELSDQDLADILAYVHAKPRHDGATPNPNLGPVGRVLVLTGGLPFPANEVQKQHLAPAQRTIAVDASYGKYLAHASGCFSCHGAGLSGGHLQGSPSDPPAQNLTPSGDLGHWTFDQFKTTIRTGTRPNGGRLNDFMPWQSFAQMTDDELRAIWLYVKSVPPKATGNG